ncbi:hypothetical protein AKJ09_03826 [Labilithrix luteola]|uniref:SCP domain-containing protein n=1 Tax=Labilithrix luteola TaxID=1391654 RepID=A0A0K1PUF9_9BACT|nr:CAP domain-containing protein [Labilithrix luteola]AKU97162.1 hypothetical protein AKJ09_03826 [Labilithrix luteola]
MRSILSALSVALLLVACGGDDSNSTDGSAGNDNSSSVTEGATVTADGDSLAELCVNTINAYRATLDLPPYERWSDAEVCANGEAKSDSESGKAHGAFPNCGEFGQNECPDWSGDPKTALPKCLRAMWNEGPGGGHYEAMRSSKYKKVACGIAETSKGTFWAVQDFR